MNPFSSVQPLLQPGSNPNQFAHVRGKLDEYLAKSVLRAATVVKNVMTIVPQDQVVPARALTFTPVDGHLEYAAPMRAVAPKTLHRNAIGQLAGRLEIPLAYVDHLQARGDWGQQLLARTLNDHVGNEEEGTRWLFRSVGTEARAVLSDKYRRIDCRPVAEALIDVAREAGMVVADGIFTETRTSLKIISPKLIEVFPGEFMVFGLDWSNSDFGRGASDLRAFFFRCWCLNGAVGESVVRQIHIGKRLQDDVEYSEKTLRLDAEATASALRDAARSAVSEGKIQRMIAGVNTANETKVDGKRAAEALRKVVTKGDVEKVVEAFNSADVENMPAGNTLWRWSNAISWVAGQVEDADKKIDLERVAGEVLKPAMPRDPAAPASV